MVTAAVFELLLDILFAGVVPFVVMAMLVPTLIESQEGVINYRGNKVVYGLGIVWVVWILLIVAFVFIERAIFSTSELERTGSDVLRYALPLVAAGVIFGMIDDAYGDSSARGFKGHLKALFSGRLTTGGLKILGIGFASFFTALILHPIRIESDITFVEFLWRSLDVVLATCTMALSANLLNLFDLRPGRAIKAYSVFMAITLLCLFIFTARRNLEIADKDTMTAAFLTLAIGILCLAPLASIWRFDLGEKAMLGDSGANAMGGIVGFLLAYSLPTSGLAVATVILFGLNFASEKVSFSKVIEGNRFLSWFDGLGRNV